MDATDCLKNLYITIFYVLTFSNEVISMKFVKKFPEMNADIDHKLLNNQWTPIKEPKKFIYSLLLSVPFMILNAFISIKIIRLFTSISLSEFGITSDGLSITINLSLIFGFVFLLFFHEFIHLMFIPNFMKSKKHM